MKEILTQLFGEAVTDEALKTFNVELGKKFVAKADFNAKSEEIKTLKAEKQSLEDEIAKLNETAKGGEDVKAELEALKAQIESDKKKAEADRIMKEKNESLEKRFNECVGDKQFVNDPTRAFYLKKFSEALESKDFEGKGDSDVFKELTQNDGDAFKGVTVVKLAGGTARPTGANVPAKDEFKKMSYNKTVLQSVFSDVLFFSLYKKSENTAIILNFAVRWFFLSQSVERIMEKFAKSS